MFGGINDHIDYVISEKYNLKAKLISLPTYRTKSLTNSHGNHLDTIEHETCQKHNSMMPQGTLNAGCIGTGLYNDVAIYSRN